MDNDIPYNINNVNANDEWNGEVAGQPITGKIVERISRNEMPYVTVEGCSHEKKVRDPEDETDTYYALVCTNCPMGWLVAKESKQEL